MRTSADSSQPERASLESCCSSSSAHGTARTAAQRLVTACLSCHLKLQNCMWRSVPGDSVSPALKMRTSADSLQPEKASLESFCSASSANGTARTEAQRLGLLACLVPSNFKRSLGGLCLVPPAALLRKCERLQIARRQKELAWKAVAHPHLPMALLAQRHRDWGCLLVLSPQTSNVD